MLDIPINLLKHTIALIVLFIPTHIHKDCLLLLWYEKYKFVDEFFDVVFDGNLEK